MQDKLITIFCVCDEVIKLCGMRDDPQSKMTHAEVLTVALVGAYLFGGNYRRARWFLQSHGYMRQMLSESRLNRRLHAFDCDFLSSVFRLVASIFSKRNRSNEFIIDSFPVACCHNIRIFRCQLFTGQEYRGYNASKKSYFYGIKVQLVTTLSGEPVDFSVSPGSQSDIRALREMSLSLPADTTLYADGGYQDYKFEKELALEGIDFLVQRRANLKHRYPREVEFIQSKLRKRIETTISQIKGLMPSRIAAVTSKGFLLKVYFFLLTTAVLML